MSAPYAYQYVVLRCVPRPEREEFVNVGVVLYSQEADFLDVAWRIDRDRLAAFAPGLDCDRVDGALRFVEGVARGDERGGAAAGKPASQRFGFLKAPKSTVIQPGPVHSGLAAEPSVEIARLVQEYVA